MKKLIDYSNSTRLGSMIELLCSCLCRTDSYHIEIATKKINDFNPITITCDLVTVDESRCMNLHPKVGEVIGEQIVYAYAVPSYRLDDFRDAMKTAVNSVIDYSGIWVYHGIKYHRSRQFRQGIEPDMNIAIDAKSLENALQYQENIGRLQRLVIRSFSFNFSDGVHVIV